MKLSEIKGERIFDVIADCIEPMARISSDPETQKMLKRESAPEGTDKTAFTMKRLQEGLPALLRNHKEDIIEILAAVDGVTPTEYEKGLNLSKFLSDATDLISDKDFMALFLSVQPRTGKTSSGSAKQATSGKKR